MRPAFLWFGAVVLAGCQGAEAQESATAKDKPPAAAAVETTTRPDDTKAISALVETFTKAFNAGDAAAVAATYAENALVVDERGERTEGRAAIKDRLAESFADSPGSTIAIEVSALRFLGPDTAIEVGRTTINSPTAGEAPEVTRFTAVYVKHDGQWLQSAVRDEYAHDLSPHDRLKELRSGWSGSGSTRARTRSCRPTASGPTTGISWFGNSP